MNKKTNIFIIFLVSLIIAFNMIIISLNTIYTLDIKAIEKKALFVQTVGLPDLAISTTTRYIRHRSLSDINSIFSDGPEYIEYAPSTFSTYLGTIANGNK
jgi:hypothetical protein